MRKKLLILFIVGCGFFLVFPPLPEKLSLISVFRVTEEPVAIVRGTNGSALTINISFGDDEVKEWIETLEKPYPLLLIDNDWAERFPETIQLIQKKKIPTGLLGHKGEAYEFDAKLLVNQAEKYEILFEEKPLWFRTIDENFPHFLHKVLWEAEINALGSTVTWSGGEIPPVTEGEIISVSHHRNDRIYLPELKQLTESRDFKTLDEVLFGPVGKMKKIPN
ncbi:hypothetical protein [Sporosarcina ureilytica]|uniref:Uncharacterized protein n=1 Tax=Sporosarcina ureilytica TaxID=298596 RepID=A0A1D8JCX6_9BACL|nr:hypothetical protein [Sporosarcina ureilytica]AOV06560.1 hypothetical protein BI350_02325 [Sporosarcina ureilytica]